jgi:hypothetical protein
MKTETPPAKGLGNRAAPMCGVCGWVQPQNRVVEPHEWVLPSRPFKGMFCGPCHDRVVRVVSRLTK